MLTTTTSYRLIASDLDRALRQKESQPEVSRETDYYLENISNVKSIDAFVDDQRLFNYAMRANGLGDMTYAKAFMVKVLEEGIDEPDSFANSLSDTRFRDFAEAFNFARYGEATTAFDRTQQGTVDKFIRQALEEDAGNDNQGVRLALYFQRRAGDISSAYSILADRALLEVVQTALNLPTAVSSQDIDKQASMIASRLDLEDLKDPDKLASFLNRFTALWDVNNPQTAPTPATVLISQPLQLGFSTSLLASIQNLRLGGR